MKKALIMVFAAVAMVRVVLAFLVWHPDLNNHVDWGIRFWQYGPAKFYTANVWSFTWPNQPPGTTYMFAGVRKLYEGTFEFLSYLHFQLHAFPGSTLLYLEKNLYPALLKLPAILSDFGIAWLIYKIAEKITKKRKLALVAGVIWLLNPVSWYNSAVWGQYDAVINFLAFLAFYLLVEKKLTLAVLIFALSLYIKASLLIFGPIFLIIALRQKYSLLSWIKSLLVALLIIGLATTPFSRGEPFGWLFNLYKDKIFSQQLQVITANGFNLWATLTGISEQPQTLPFAGLTYQYWSYIMFSIFYIPALYVIYKKQDIKAVVWSLAAASFASFVLLTNMHERYLYPLFPYFTVLIVTYRNLFANYVVTSIINLLNLYNFWWIPAFPGLIDFMSVRGRLVPRILGGVILLMFTLFYIRFFKYELLGKRNENTN